MIDGIKYHIISVNLASFFFLFSGYLFRFYFLLELLLGPYFKGILDLLFFLLYAGFYLKCLLFKLC
jgi:hypothetical protein